MTSKITNQSLSAKRVVSVYKSYKKDEMYLFVDKKEGLDQVPKTLTDIFGKPEPVFDLLLTPDKKMARSDAREVLENIGEKGFYLQMPPPPEELLPVVKAKEMMPVKGSVESD